MSDSKSFSELIASEVQNKPEEYALSVLKAFKEGDPSAQKFVQKVLEDSRYTEENTFPINDARLKQIITTAAELISSGEL